MDERDALSWELECQKQCEETMVDLATELEPDDPAFKKLMELRDLIQGRDEKLQKIMAKLANQVNAMGSGKFVIVGLLKGFVRQHRTLQQSIVRALVGMLTMWGKGDEAMYSDLRNEASFKWAKELGKNPPMLPSL